MRTIVWIGFLAAVIAAPAITSGVFAQQLVGEGEIAGTKIIVRELKRDEGGTVTVKLQLVNETDESKDIFEMILGNDWVHLIDAANKKKYFVITDRSGKCECTDGSQLRSVSKGSPVNIWARFPAPPDDVRALTVVVKSFDPVDSVPVTAR